MKGDAYRWLLVCGLGLLGPLACLPERSEVKDGYYEAISVHGHDPADESHLLATSLDIDLASGAAVFNPYAGTEIPASFTARDRSEWVDGCPTNFSNTVMEVLEIDESTLAIGPLTFENPVLIASCPEDNDDVVLTEDGTESYGGIPCRAETDKCLIFSLVQD